MKKIFFLFFILIISWAQALTVDIYLGDRYLVVHNGDNILYDAPVLGGRKKYPTPIGFYKIYRKERVHKSSKWPKGKGGAKMPFSMFLQNVNTGRKTGVALHAGSLRVKSHGCIHLDWTDAQELYFLLDVGDAVNIYE